MPLARFVERIWILHDDTLAYSAKIFPDGIAQLVLNLGAPYNVERADGVTASFTAGSLSGERMRALTVKQARSCHQIGVRFRPGGAFPFIGIPLGQFQEAIVDIELVWSHSEVETLRERLSVAASAREQCMIVEQALLSRAGRNLQTNSTVEIAMRYLSASDEPSITQIAESIGISHKHLLRQFDTYVGLNPKALAQLQRFQRSLAMLNTREDLSLTEIAYECSYYDQSHFVHEFERFTGMKPSAYLGSRRKALPSLAQPQYAPIEDYLRNLVSVAAP